LVKLNPHVDSLTLYKKSVFNSLSGLSGKR